MILLLTAAPLFSTVDSASRRFIYRLINYLRIENVFIFFSIIVFRCKGFRIPTNPSAMPPTECVNGVLRIKQQAISLLPTTLTYNQLKKIITKIDNNTYFTESILRSDNDG